MLPVAERHRVLTFVVIGSSRTGPEAVEPAPLLRDTVETGTAATDGPLKYRVTKSFFDFDAGRHNSVEDGGAGNESGRWGFVGG